MAGDSCMVVVASSARSSLFFSSVFFFSLCLLGRCERVAGPVPKV